MSGGLWRVVQQDGVACLGFSRRDVTDRREQAEVLEPVHLFERGIMDLAGGRVSPRRAYGASFWPQWPRPVRRRYRGALSDSNLGFVQDRGALAA